MKRILITAFSETNFGDDLFVKILCERYPKHQFYINCSRFNDTAYESIPNLTIMNRTHFKGMIIHNFKKLLRKLGIQINFPYHAQVYIGGSIFIEYKNQETISHYFNRLHSIKSSPNLPFFIVGANFGPYYTQNFLTEHKKYFSSCVTDLCMRDATSYNLFKELPNIRYAPDIICGYHLPALKKKNLIVISCIFNDHRDELLDFDNDLYAKKMASLCDFYLSLGKQVCLLAMCKFQQDHTMCERIKELSLGAVDILEYTGDIEKVITLCASAEYIIASRFHAMVLGWLSQTPVFPISYSNKTVTVIKDYGFNGNYAMIDKFCELSCEEIDENRVNRYLFRDIQQLRMESQNHFLKLDEFMSK